jgi:hypothetical protein
MYANQMIHYSNHAINAGSLLWGTHTFVLVLELVYTVRTVCTVLLPTVLRLKTGYEWQYLFC